MPLDPTRGLTALHMNPRANVLTYVGSWPVSVKLNPSWKTEISKSTWIKLCIRSNYLNIQIVSVVTLVKVELKRG